MSISIQTNVDSLVAQSNLSTNSTFQSRTIKQLTSGYRINSSADDAAGLAIANSFRSTEAELAQGVQNGNDGISTLQIVDGGMKNISTMLDRLRTLSTQSASGTFTGDRRVLDNEFQGLLTEINRQSQSVGLNQGGQFAAALSVYIGGGKSADSSGSFSSINGTVSFDLSKSSVDTQSLGLTGLQVVAGAVDMSAASTTSLSKIVSNTSNTTAVSGFTQFEFAGPGFSAGSQVAASVNLSGVTDMSSMATALNAAIQSAANSASPSAAAFKSANIVASVHTDSNGGQQLAFTSSTTAFQVQAGDMMANALMGNLASGTTGAAITSTVTGGNTTAGAVANPTTVKFEIVGGGLTSPVTFSLGAGSTTTALGITDITSQIAGNTSLQAAGITVSGSAGSPLVFTDAQGNKLNVQVSGDTANRFGFGSFVASGAGSDYTTVTGSGFTGTAAYGSSHLEFSINGGASSSNGIDVDLAAGDATAATVTGTAGNAASSSLTVNIDGAGATTIALTAGATTALLAAGEINTAAAGVTATVNGLGALVLTANAKGGHSVVIGGAAATTLGVAGTITGTSRTAQSIADALNTGIAANASLAASGLQATVSGGQLNIASSNGTAFRVNAGTSAVTADVGFGVLGAAFAGATVANSAATFDDANGATNTTALTFGAMKYGNDTQTLTISSNNSDGAMVSKTLTLQNNATAKTGESIDQAVSYINQQLQQSNNATLQNIVAVKENVGGVEKINFLSSLKSFSVSFGSSPNGDGFSSPNAGNTVTSTTLGTSATVSIGTQASAQQALAAVASAVTKLGAAQAAVGKGQNQLNYAIGLAQSQIINFSAAESRIRDTDVAAQAANLTKAQVLQQATIAAMAQANSEPQSILSLLKG